MPGRSSASTPRLSGSSCSSSASICCCTVTSFGNHVFATGGNPAAATAIGINTDRVKVVAFAIAGGMAAFAGILATARVGSVQPGQGAGLELQAIAACVIGGLSLTGGRGSIIGIFLGVMLIHTITDVLLLLRAPGFYLDMFIATLIVVAAAFNHLIERQGAGMMSAPNPRNCTISRKSFGALTRCADLSFHIDQGEVVGLLGDNGAGKSTTVNLISGIHKPTSGLPQHRRQADDCSPAQGFRRCRHRNDLPEYRAGEFAIDHAQHLHGARTLPMPSDSSS